MVSVDHYLSTSYQDGDREFLDGVVVERSVGAPDRSALLKIVVAQLARFEKALRLAVRPACRTRITDTRYRVPDVLVMRKPFRQSKRVLLDPPFLIVEIVSPDDRMRDTLIRFRDYEHLGVRHKTIVSENGGLQHRDLTSLEVPDRGLLPFDSRKLLARLDEE